MIPRLSDEGPLRDAGFWLPQVLRRLEAYYWSPGGPSEKTHADMTSAGALHWKDALVMFYRHYAYERAGAPRSWGTVAAEAIEGAATAVGLSALADRAWLEFKSEVPKPNPRNNSLCSDQAAAPITRFVTRLASDRYNLIAWAARLLGGGKGMEAYRVLQEHIGIGPKIASFFLRDVLVSHGIPEGAAGDRRCILPVDVWVRRGVATLTARRDLTDEARDSLTQRAGLTLADDLGIGVATLDTGLWVLGARFARSPFKMEAALRDPARVRLLVDEELRREENAVYSLRQLAAGF